MRGAPVRGDWLVLDREPGDPPELPDAPRGGWSPQAEREWVAWWASPASVMWDESDRAVLERLLLAVHDWWVNRTPAGLSAIRVQQEALGLTAKGRQDRRWLLPVERDAGLTPVEAARVIPISAGGK